MIWQWTPFMMLIVLAGLQSQPPDDARGGQGRRRRAPAPTFRELTLPAPAARTSSWRPARLDLPGQTRSTRSRPMTQGGPGTSTTNLPYYLYQTGEQRLRHRRGGRRPGWSPSSCTIIVATFALRMFARVFQFEEA